MSSPQHGLSLVEIMIAMTIGLLVIAGIFQLFLNTRLSNSTQNGMSSLYENARYAMFILGEDLMMAGYDNATGTIPQGITASVDNNSGDEITISYQSTRDCTRIGTGTPGGTITNRYFIGTSNGVSNLMCQGSVGGTQPLVEGVENMQFLYGEDLDNDNIADLYVSAPNVTDWTRVVSIRVALLIASMEDVATTADSNGYILFNPPPITPTTNLLQRRRVFNRLILLRNNIS
ncbi:MAG: PilW family protein [Gammaproteobacteria bacterium]|nr:PilW family protein [Gammaproteobacteria bacterium]